MQFYVNQDGSPSSNELENGDFDSREQRFVFDFMQMMAVLNNQTSTEYPRLFKEGENYYRRPRLSCYTKQTETDGHVLIGEFVLPVDPLYCAQANGIWNHVYESIPTIQDLPE